MRIDNQPGAFGQLYPDSYMMKTVTQVYDGPLAGSGFNTIRKLSEKYAMLRPGDRVTMSYVKSAEDTDAMVVEQLKVSSVVAGTLADIVKRHWHRNYGGFVLREGCYEGIKSIYGGDDTGLFLAIYF